VNAIALDAGVFITEAHGVVDSVLLWWHHASLYATLHAPMQKKIWSVDTGAMLNQLNQITPYAS